MAFINGVLTIILIIMAMTVLPAMDLEGLGQRLVLVFQLSFYIHVATAVVHVSLSPNTPESSTTGVTPLVSPV